MDGMNYLTHFESESVYAIPIEVLIYFLSQMEVKWDYQIGRKCLLARSISLRMVNICFWMLGTISMHGNLSESQRRSMDLSRDRCIKVYWKGDLRNCSFPRFSLSHNKGVIHEA